MAVDQNDALLRQILAGQSDLLGVLTDIRDLLTPKEPGRIVLGRSLTPPTGEGPTQDPDPDEPIEVREPVQPDPEPEPVTEPESRQQPAKRAPAKKTAKKGTAAKRGTRGSSATS